MSGLVGYLMATSLVGVVAAGALAELGQQVAATLRIVANALQAAGAGG